MSDKVLIVAFDGMDYELIKNYDLEYIKQEEFGSIDNDTGIKYRYTSELFASFITGADSDEHGIVKLVKDDYNLLKRFLRSGLVPNNLVDNYRGFWRLNQITKSFIELFMDFNDVKYSKEDLKTSTFFEEIDCAKPLFVPSYNPDLRWQLSLPHNIAKVGSREEVREYCKKMTRSRLDDLDDLTLEFWDLIMLHLHDPDPMQDLELGGYRKDYERLDEIAKAITEKFSDEWTIIFMSDHGRMEGREHNTNAFYSCNKELFGEDEPHITDFYYKVINLT